MCFGACVHTTVWLTAAKGSMLTLRPSSAPLDRFMLWERWKKRSHTEPSSSCFHLEPSLWPLLSTREGEKGGVCVCVRGVVVLLLALGVRPEPKGRLFSHSFIQSLFRGVSGAVSVI